MKKLVLGGVLALVVLTPLLLVVRVSRAEAAWAKSFGPIDAVPAKFRTAENETAAMLPQWSERIAPREKAQSAVFDYLTVQINSTSGRAEPNAFVQTFRAAEIDEFARWIAENPPPVFSHPFRSPDEPIPNLLVVLRLQKTLLAAAMARSADKDTAGAERLLEASWRVNEPFLRAPTIIEQLIGEAVFRYQLAVLRKTDVDASKWLPRIRSVDFVKSIAAAYEAYAWHIDRSVRENVYASEAHLRQERAWLASVHQSEFKPRWLQILRTPIRWFDLASVLDGNREMLLALPTLPRSEHIDRDLAAAYRRGLGAYIPDPDVTGAETLGSAFRRAVRTLGERELTEKVLMARAARKTNGGRWPAQISGIESSAIANTSWIYEPFASTAVIRLGRPVDWGVLFGITAPLRCELR